MEHVVAGEGADLLVGGQAVLAHGTVVAQLPPQGRRAAERPHPEPPPAPRQPAAAVGLHGPETHADADEHGDAAHGHDGDGLPEVDVVVVGHVVVVPSHF